MSATTIKLRVTYTDGRTHDVLVGPRAQVACERHFKKSMMEIGQSGSIESVYFLAWAALHFAGKEPKDFDHFLDDLADVSPLDTEPANPTDAAR